MKENSVEYVENEVAWPQLEASRAFLERKKTQRNLEGGSKVVRREHCTEKDELAKVPWQKGALFPMENAAMR